MTDSAKKVIAFIFLYRQKALEEEVLDVRPHNAMLK